MITLGLIVLLSLAAHLVTGDPAAVKSATHRVNILSTDYPVQSSKIAVYDLAAGKVEVVFEADGVIEAPNWSRDGQRLLVSSGGNLLTLSLTNASSTLEKVSLEGLAPECNNDKGYSPDGTLLAFSSSGGQGSGDGSQVFLVSSSGGQPQLVVPETESYFHGFSPDGKFMAYVLIRNGSAGHLFRVPTDATPEAHAEEPLTSVGYDDGPDYSPDGKWIYFNSNRSGKWEIWRMPSTGAGDSDVFAEQVTFDEDHENWFPHCSPDGQWIVFVSYPKGTATHDPRIPGVSVRLIAMPSDKLVPVHAQDIKTLSTFFGGQGTMNINSWSPDSTKFAFIIFVPPTTTSV